MKQLKKEKEGSKRKNLQFLITRINNQESSSKAKTEKSEQVHKSLSEIKEKTGKRFVNKCKYGFVFCSVLTILSRIAVLKKDQLVEKFKMLKQTGKLDKYLEKKRKKNTSRERKKINI